MQYNTIIFIYQIPRGDWNDIGLIRRGSQAFPIIRSICCQVILSSIRDS